jgi:hypothetical protein
LRQQTCVHRCWRASAGKQKRIPYEHRRGCGPHSARSRAGTLLMGANDAGANAEADASVRSRIALDLNMLLGVQRQAQTCVSRGTQNALRVRVSCLRIQVLAFCDFCDWDSQEHPGPDAERDCVPAPHRAVRPLKMRRTTGAPSALPSPRHKPASPSSPPVID